MSLVVVVAMYLVWFAAYTIYKDHIKVCIPLRDSTVTHKLAEIPLLL